MDKKQIHEAIKSYHWMMNLLISKRKETITGGGLTSKYGIDAALPKGNDISDPIYQEILRIEKHEQNTRKIRDKVIFIQKHSRAVKNTKNRIILDMLLDGMPLREIALELDMSLSGVNSRKNMIVDQIYESAQKEQMEQMEQMKQKEKVS